MSDRTVLISGAGIAGPTLAYWLGRAGWKTTLVERAALPRRGGYMIDFWGLGYDIADRMGLCSDLNRLGYHVKEMRVVGDEGERQAGLGTRAIDKATHGRFVTIRRSDLSRLLLEKARTVSEVRFDDEIAHLAQDDNGVDVTFKRGAAERYDLVIGAGGLHSIIRDIMFGSEDHFERFLGYRVAAFECGNYRARNPDVYLIHNKPGRMVGRFSLRSGQTLFLFVFADDTEDSELDLDAQKTILRKQFGDCGWECPRILEKLDHARSLYFDRVSQIHLQPWSQGRVALIGDAAFCVSLLAGQGAALAMTAAYVLAGELANAQGDHKLAFQAYEKILRPYIELKQRKAKNFAGAFAPKTSLGLLARNAVMAATSLPGVARLALGSGLTDSLELPEYRWPSVY